MVVDLPPHVAWEELIDGVVVSFIRPVSPRPDPRSMTGAAVGFVVDQEDGSALVISLPIFAWGLDADQQEIALAIIRTVQAEEPAPFQ